MLDCVGFILFEEEMGIWFDYRYGSKGVWQENREDFIDALRISISLLLFHFL